MNKKWRFFTERLRDWHHPNERRLPWKGVRDPYLVWVSEIFLQQTQAERVVEFYLRFTSRFPTVQSLARTNFEKALPYFRGLGYYQRLRNMLATAKTVVHNFSGKFPKTVEELRQFPGIGEYTARAIVSFAFGKKAIAPDTNVRRVLERYFSVSFRPVRLARHGRARSGRRRERRNPFVFFDRHYPVHFNLNQALMDLGATVCLARKPKCGECPLAKKCHETLKNTFSRGSGDPPFDDSGRTLRSAPHEAQGGSQRVAKSSRKSIFQRFPIHYQKVVVGVLIQDKRVLVSRRKPKQTYSGLLEFPGGKVEAGEDLRRAMQREFREELGVEVSVRPPFRKIVQHRKKQVLIFHRCRILTGKPQPLEGQEMRWVEQRSLRPREFIPANKGIIRELQKSRL